MVMEALGLLVMLTVIMIVLLILVLVVLLVGRESVLAAIVFAFEMIVAPGTGYDGNPTPSVQEQETQSEPADIEILGWIDEMSPCCQRELEQEGLRCVAPDDP